MMLSGNLLCIIFWWALCLDTNQQSARFRVILPSQSDDPNGRLFQMCVDKLKSKRDLSWQIGYGDSNNSNGVITITKNSSQYSAAKSTELNDLPAKKIRIVVWEGHGQQDNEEEAHGIESFLHDQVLLNGILTRIKTALHVWQDLGNNLIKDDGTNITFSFTVSKTTTASLEKKGRRGKDIPKVAKKLSAMIAKHVEQEFNWTRSPKYPNLGFHLVESNSGLVSLELTAMVRIFPLKDRLEGHRRSRYRHKRIESFLVAKTANITSGENILDPICGRATFVIEAAKYWPMAKYYGIDSSIPHLEHATMNADSTMTSIRLFQSQSACRLPLEDGSIDKILTCCPNGRSTSYYRNLIREWSRVLRNDGTGKMTLVVNVKDVDVLVRTIERYIKDYSVSFIRTPFTWGKQKASLLVVNHDMNEKNEQIKEKKRNNEHITTMPKSSSKKEYGKCWWEVGTGQDQVLWANIRSQTIPPLVPVTHAQQTQRCSSNKATLL